MRDTPLLLSRRALVSGLASAGGLLVAGCSETQPPTYGNVLRMGSEPLEGASVGEWLDMRGDRWVRSDDGEGWTRQPRG